MVQLLCVRTAYYANAADFAIVNQNNTVLSVTLRKYSVQYTVLCEYGTFKVHLRVPSEAKLFIRHTNNTKVLQSSGTRLPITSACMQYSTYSMHVLQGRPTQLH